MRCKRDTTHAALICAALGGAKVFADTGISRYLPGRGYVICALPSKESCKVTIQGDGNYTVERFAFIDFQTILVLKEVNVQPKELRSTFLKLVTTEVSYA
jgi:hypothetical protein